MQQFSWPSTFPELIFYCYKGLYKASHQTNQSRSSNSSDRFGEQSSPSTAELPARRFGRMFFSLRYSLGRQGRDVIAVSGDLGRESVEI